MTLTRLGNDSDWMMTAAGAAHFLALKRNGTLWGWGDNSSGQLSDGLPEKVRVPMQVGEESDWVVIAGSWNGSVAVKSNNSLWQWGGANKGGIDGEMVRVATLPAKASSIESTLHSTPIVLCEDGSAWGHGAIMEGNFLGSGRGYSPEARWTQLSDDGRWQQISWGGSQYNGGIQRDGSLWLQNSHGRNATLPAPERIGKRNDWISLRTSYGPLYALARDGTLCRFGEEIHSGEPLLAPTRRVTWSINVLDSVK